MSRAEIMEACSQVDENGAPAVDPLYLSYPCPVATRPGHGLKTKRLAGVYMPVPSTNKNKHFHRRILYLSSPTSLTTKTTTTISPQTFCSCHTQFLASRVPSRRPEDLPSNRHVSAPREVQVQFWCVCASILWNGQRGRTIKAHSRWWYAVAEDTTASTM